MPACSRNAQVGFAGFLFHFTEKDCVSDHTHLLLSFLVFIGINSLFVFLLCIINFICYFVMIDILTLSIFTYMSKIHNIVYIDRHMCKTTVDSESFARFLFSRNFTYAKFRENKILTKWRNHSVVY